MSADPSPDSGNRTRRALTQGGSLDGMMLTLLTLAGVAGVALLLAFSFQRAEVQAEKDTGHAAPAPADHQTEIGNN